MINSSAAFQSAIAQDSRLFRARLLMAGTPIAGDIKTIKIHKGSCGSSEFSPGICFCPYIEAVIDNLTVAVEGVELQLQIGIMIGGDYSDPILDYITIGNFTACKPETSVYRSTFTAQGRIASRMSGAFVPPDELTVASVAAKLQSDTGVSILFAEGLDTSVPIAGTMNNLTCREALAVLAAVVGGYATETAEGEVKVDVFSNTVTASYAADNMLEPPVFADYDVLITGVEVIAVESSEDVEEVSYRSGDPVNVVISNSYMTENAFAQFAANIIGLQYRPGSIPLSLGDPRLEPWDVLQITDAAGISFIVPCMNLVHTYDGGFATDIEAPALPDETQVPSQIEKAIKIALSAENEAARARTAAEQAETDARTAARSASEAQTSASQAATSASQAASRAAAAEQASTRAESAATQAEGLAEQANTYATSALGQLSVVQDVVGVLNWASEHGTFTRTTDTAIEDGKVYFTYDSSTGDYTPVIEPDVTQIATYYELTVNEAMQSYIMAHLAVTERGLWVLPSGINTGDVTPETGETMDDAQARLGAKYKVLLSNTGMIVYDGAGVAVASYGENIEFSSTRSQYIGGEDAYITFYDSNNDGVGDSIRIGGNVTFGGTKPLSEVLAELDKVESTLIYDHDYVISNGVATFTAYLYSGGEDVKTQYDPTQFTWSYKTTDGELQPLDPGYGYTQSINISAMSYGGHVVGRFITTSNSELLNENDDSLTNSNDQQITARTPSGETIRVSDLSVSTTLYPTDRIMIVGNEDEHLVTVQTLQNYLDANLDKQVKFNTTAGWAAQITYVSQPDELYVYTDYKVDKQGNYVAGIKIGDGNAYVVDLPFIDAIATEHMANTVVHITNEERAFWNNKVSCYYAGTEQLVFTTT